MKEEAIRKVAILVSALEAEYADTLLEKMGEEQAARVRNALLYLADVSAEEERAVLAEFFGDGQTTLVEEPQPEVSIEQTTLEAAPQPARGESAPFHFLHSASVPALFKQLKPEHNQVVAVVVRHLPPHSAADLVKRFDPPRQVEILRRVARLDSADPEVLQELENELRSRLTADLNFSGWTAGLQTVSSIVAAAAEESDELWANLQRFDQNLADNVEAGQSAPHLPESDPLPPELTLPSDAGLSTRSESKPALAELRFEDLVVLADAELALVFATAEPEVTLLALADAPDPILERIVRELPSQGIRDLNQRIEQLGTIRLSDVERAQQVIAEIATDLLQAGKIRLPGNRVAAAA